MRLFGMLFWVGYVFSFVWGDLLRNENLPSWLFREL